MPRKNKAANAANDATSNDVAPIAIATTAVAPIALRTAGGFTLGNVARTADTVARGATHYGATSYRDGAYAAFYYLNRDANGVVTLAALAAYQRNPHYAGSAKPHDAGAINRAARAGTIVKANDGASFTFTERGETFAKLMLAKLAPSEPASDAS